MMATFWELLKPEDREKLTGRFGVTPKLPKDAKRAIRYETGLETVAEIARLMKKTPPYTISVQGRR